MNKEDIFDNLPEFTAQDLFKPVGGINLAHT